MQNTSFTNFGGA
ncbi:MAG: hypothetical protein CBC44_000490 [Flavobacteriales bacterium TMED84]|nr:MAG: hypothetical protein CBC44_000490 [Flavobacteriales bacterium TMED84]